MSLRTAPLCTDMAVLISEDQCSFSEDCTSQARSLVQEDFVAKLDLIEERLPPQFARRHSFPCKGLSLDFVNFSLSPRVLAWSCYMRQELAAECSGLTWSRTAAEKLVC